MNGRNRPFSVCHGLLIKRLFNVPMRPFVEEGALALEVAIPN